MIALNLLGLTIRTPHIRKKINKDLAHCLERTDLENSIFFRFIDFLEDFCKFIYMNYSGNVITKEMARDWRRLFAFVDLNWKRYEFDIYACDVLGTCPIDVLFSDFYKFFWEFGTYLCGQWPNKLSYEYADSKEGLKEVRYHLNLLSKIFHSLEYSFKKNTIIIKEVDKYYLNCSKKNINDALKEEFGESVWLDAFKDNTAEA